MNRKLELAKRADKVAEIRSLLTRVEEQRSLCRLRPLADETNGAETLLLAAAFHDLISRGVPPEFSVRARNENEFFRSTQPVHSTASFREHPPELLLDDILKSLVFLEELYRDEIRQLKRQSRWWKSRTRR